MNVAALKTPICLVGRKAKRLPAGAGVMDLLQRENPTPRPVGPTPTSVEAEQRLARRPSSFAEPEIIGYSGDSGPRLRATVFNPAIFT